MIDFEFWISFCILFNIVNKNNLWVAAVAMYCHQKYLVVFMIWDS